MRVTRPGLALGSAIISSLLLAGVADAQSGGRKAPRINLSTPLGASVVTNYIEPAVTLSEDAYVFVISVDVDRNIQVLHPTDLDLSVKMAAKRQLHLPRFFAGFGGGDGFASRGGRYASYDGYGSGYTDTRGTLIALASRRPFNLAAVTIGGDWDQIALRRLVEDREPYSAASVLAKYLGAPGEPIGRDVLRFAGGGSQQYYASSYYDCHPVYGAMGYGISSRGVGMMRAYALRQAGYQVYFLGFDGCGQPRYAVSGTTIVGNPGGGNPPAAGSFPDGRLPSTAARNPAKGQSASGQLVGSRPVRGGYTDGDDAPSLPTRISEPRPVPERFHPQPAGGTTYERPRISGSNAEPRGGTVQAERPAPARATPPPPPERMSVPRPIPERVTQPAYTPPERSSPPPRSEPSGERARPAPAPDPTPPVT